MNWYKKAKQEDYRTIGNIYWFEYRCWESPQSSDAKLWYHSHQKIKLLKLIEKGIGKNQDERAAEGCPATYKAQFMDGLVYDVMEDEVLDSPAEFINKDPPKIKGNSTYNKK